LKSLENQTNQNFEVAFILNEKFFEEEKYKFIFQELSDTPLKVRFIPFVKGTRLTEAIAPVVKEAYDEYDFVIQSRMDFDDFIYRGAVDETQNKVNECENILSYGYCRGYEYVYEELYNRENLYKGIGHLAILSSIILKSSFAKNLLAKNFPFIGAYSFLPHPQTKIKMKSFFEKKADCRQKALFK